MFAQMSFTVAVNFTKIEIINNRVFACRSRAFHFEQKPSANMILLRELIGKNRTLKVGCEVVHATRQIST